MTGECGTAHTHDTGLLDFLHNGLGIKVGTVFQTDKGIATVNAFLPFVAFHIYIDCHTACVAGIKGNINLADLTTYAGVYGCTDKTSGFAQQGTNLYNIAFLHDWLGRSTDMLEHTENCLLGQCSLTDRTAGTELVLGGMYTAYSKCLHMGNILIL